MSNLNTGSYAHRYAARYDIGWWVPAESHTLAEATLADLAIRLGARATLSSAQLARQLHTLLARRTNWLLIFDNSSNPADLQPFLPVEGGGHVLITSRTMAWAGLADPISVDVLSVEAAVELLVTRTGDTNVEVARSLAEELGGLALALEQAAAYCAEYSLTLAAYLSLFRTRRAVLLARGQPLAYNGTVDVAFTLLMEEVNRTKPESVQLLQVCSLLAPDAIPVDELLRRPRYLPPELAAAVIDPVLRTEVLGALFRVSLLTADVGDTARLHRLVREVVYGRIEPTTIARLVERVIDLLVDLFPEKPGDLAMRAACAELVSHASALIMRGDQAAVANLNFATLLDRVSYYLLVWTSDMETAAAFQEQALSMRERLHPGDHPDTAMSLNGLATTMRHMGRLERSRQLHEEAFRMHQRVHPGDHPDTATTLTDLSFTCSRLGDIDAAFEYGRQALEMRRRLNVGDHMDIVVSMNDLSVALRKRGEPDRALDLNEEALAMALRLYDGDHPEIAQSYYELGVTNRQLGHLVDALLFAERALEMRQRLHPDDHRHTARSWLDVGLTLREMGNLNRARTAVKESLTMREQLHPGDHPETAESLEVRGYCERQLGQNVEAESLITRASEMRGRLYSE